MSAKISGRQKSEAKRRIIIVNPSVCYYCRAPELTSKEKHCPYCGFPQFGSQVEMKRFVWNINNKQQLLSEYIKAIDNAKFTLFGISIISLFLSFFFISYHEKIPAIILLVNSGIYIFLWKWSEDKPFITISIGLISYMILIVLFFSITSINISSGFYILIAIGLALFYGYKSVKKGKYLLLELEYIAKAKGLNFILEEPIKEEEESMEEDNEFNM